MGKAEAHLQPSLPRRHTGSIPYLQELGYKRTDVRTFRTTALALLLCCRSCMHHPYAWSRSAHAPKMDPALNSSCRAFTGCLRLTKVQDVYLLCSIAPSHTSEGWSCPRKKRTNKKTIYSTHSLFQQQPVGKWLKARHSFLNTVELLEYQPSQPKDDLLWSF